MKLHAFLAALLLLGFLSVSMATQCYVCTADDSCSDAYTADDGHDMDCDANIAYTEDGGCSKQKTKTKVLGILVSTVTRSCGQMYDNSECEQKDHSKTNILGVSFESWSCSCEGDNCNASSQLAVSAAGCLLVLVCQLF